MSRVYAASKDWIVRKMKSLFIRQESQPTESLHFEINDDAGVIHITEDVDKDSFVAGMRACDELHRISEEEARKSKSIPLYNNVLDVD